MRAALKFIALLALFLGLAAAARAQVCAIPGFSGVNTALSGAFNTYYAGSTLGAAATTVNIGAQRAGGSTTAIAVGDLILVMQMQGATLNTTDTTQYGDGQGVAFTRQDAAVAATPSPSPTVAFNAATNATDSYAGGVLSATAGRYEYAVVTAVTSATQLRVRGAGAGGGLINAYTQTTGANQNTYQVIRVPQLSNAIITGAVSPPAWDGSTGGVVALDVAGQLTVNANIDVSQRGFRGGGVRNIGAITAPQYGGWRALYATNLGGMKGEGIVGTPARVYDSANNALSALAATDGYVDGDVGRGAPGNAGGGGNQHNAGGGGGGNGGAGGNGGGSWNANTNGQAGWQTGGYGGFPIASTSGTSRIFLGGGGGAGDVGGNGSTDPQGSGANGGGIIILRAGAIGGSGSLLANGGSAPNTGSTDASGGGGAGGSIFVTALSGGVGLNMQASGGNGGSNNMGANNPEQDGPGGGGGGGVIYTQAGSLGAVAVGINGTVTTANTAPTDAPNYYARGGQTGITPAVIEPLDAVGVRAGFSCPPAITVSKSASPTVITSATGATTSYQINVSNGALSGGVTNLNIFDETLPPGWTLAAPATYAYSPATSATRLGAGAESTAGIAPALPAQALTSLATSFPLITTPNTAATTGQNALRWGSFFLEQGASLTISFTVNIADTAPVGNYHNAAGASFLDPTRASADGNRLVTPATANGANRNSINYSNNTAFSLAGAGSVGGGNYSGLSSGPTAEDVLLQGDLSISKSVSPVGTVSPGQTLVYTLTPRNNGRAIRDTTFAADQTTPATNTDTASRILAASTVRVTDTLPANLTITTAFQGAGWSCTGSGPVVCDRTPTVVPLAAQTNLAAITATVRVLTAACPGPLTNTAVIGSLQAPYSETSSINNATNVSNSLACSANLSVTKTNGVTSPTALTAGQTTNYTITFSNAGPSSADGSIARDVPSAGLSGCTVVPTSCVATGGSPAATCPAAANFPNLLTAGGLTLPNFPSGSSISFVVSCGVTASGL